MALIRRRPIAWWIDDEPDSLSLFKPIVENAGVRLVEFMGPLDIPSDEDIPALVFMDLNHGAHAPDGALLARQFHQRSPETAIIFVSSFFGTLKFNRVEETISPLALTARIDKADLEIAAGTHYNMRERESRAESMNTIKARLLNVMEKQAQSDKVLVPQFRNESLVKLDTEAYEMLDLRERAVLLRAARKDIGPYLDQVFARHAEVDWLVLDVPGGEVVEWGRGSPPASRADVRAIARASSAHGVPMVFQRPSSVDS